MKTSATHQLRLLLIAVSLAGFLTPGRAATYSLAGDFTYAENNADSLWSFRMDDYANNPPTFLPLLSSTNLNANQIWGTAFPNPPVMWTEGTGYWGIGKNTSGAEQSASGVTWAPDEVLLHPKGGASPARLVICWRAPRSMVVNVHYSFRKAMGCGNGVGYELRTRIGGVDTEVVAFNNIGGGVTRDQMGLSLGAGDQIFFRIDSWGDAGCDITGAAIDITAVVGPPVISADPVGGSVAEGCNFNLSVAANNATGYAWYKDGTLLSGGGPIYPMIDARPGDAGSYTVVATNASQSVTSAPAVLAVTTRPTYATVLLSENFGAYSGIQNNVQYQTGLKVSHSGTVPGWNRAGGGAIHAVDRTGASNYAAMIWQDNVLTLAEAVPANESGETYHVDFVAAPATYSEGSQATTETDGVVVEVLRAADYTVLANYTCNPGAWGSQSFRPFTFQYQGDGTGPVFVRVGPLAPSGHFGGSIDNLRLATDYVPTLPPEITLNPTGGTVAEGSDFAFSVVATGLPAYQWTKDGAPISEATNATYSILDVQTNHAGAYAVILANAAGSVTSAPALLNVTPWPIYATYTEAVLTDNPIHYYPFDETSGTIVADAGQFGDKPGTCLGGFTLGQASASSRLGSCVLLDGQPGSLVDLGTFHPGDAVTVEAWANLDPTARASWNIVVSRWDGSYEIDLDPTDIPNFNIRRDGNGFGQAVAASPSARGLWHHLVLVFAGGKVTGYVDGVKASEQNIGGVLQNAGPTPDRVMIGATRDGTNSSFNWKGRIDEVAIYHTELSAAQIRAHYRAAQLPSQSLAVQRGTGGTVVVSWPGFSPGYVLQTATNVLGPYENYSGNISVQGDRLTAEVPTAAAQTFFRLVKP